MNHIAKIVIETKIYSLKSPGIKTLCSSVIFNIVVVHVLKISLSRFTNFVLPLLECLSVLVITKVLVRTRKIHVKKDPWSEVIVRGNSQVRYRVK